MQKNQWSSECTHLTQKVQINKERKKHRKNNKKLAGIAYLTPQEYNGPHTKDTQTSERRLF